MLIRKKIAAIVACNIVFFAASMIFALVQIDRMESEIEVIQNEVHELGRIAIKIANERLSQITDLHRTFVRASQVAASGLSDDKEYQEYKKRFLTLSDLVVQHIAVGKPIINRILKTNNQGRSASIYADAITHLSTIEKSAEGFALSGGEIVELIELGNLAQAGKALDELSKSEQQLSGELARRALLSRVGNLARASYLRAGLLKDRTQAILFITVLASIVLGLYTSLRVTRSVTEPLQIAVDAADKIAEGDYDVVIDEESKGDIGQLLHAMRHMLDSIKISKQALTNQANELFESNVSLEKLNQDLSTSNSELEQFAYVASHDLQEPLRMIGSYSKLLERRYGGKLDESADEFIGFIVDGVGRMQRLITDLLKFSRVGAKHEPLAEVNFETVVDDVKSVLQVAIDEAGATVTRGALPTLVCNETQIFQVIQNLVGNAIKFRGERAPEVRIEAEQIDKDWRFSIRDNGIGIGRDQYEQIFLIFQRLHKREEYAGTGIGLAICKKIVERHGGKIWIESELGEGTTFFFTIPVESINAAI